MAEDKALADKVAIITGSGKKIGRAIALRLAAAGRAALDTVITQQAQIIAYLDDFKLLLILTLDAFPLLFFFRKPSPDADPGVHGAA